MQSGRGGESAYAEDLKSSGAKAPCGFDPAPGKPFRTTELKMADIFGLFQTLTLKLALELKVSLFPAIDPVLSWAR